MWRHYWRKTTIAGSACCSRSSARRMRRPRLRFVAYLRAVSERPPRRRAQPAALVVRPEAARLAAPASPVGRALSADLVARRLAAARHLAIAGAGARSRAQSPRAGASSRSRWACATAVRRSRRPCRSCVPGERTGCCCFRSTRSTQARRRDRPTTRCSSSCRCCGSCRHSGSSRRTTPHAAYIEALAESVREAMTPLPRPPDKIIISFHGIPQRFVDRGDPYASHCEATARSLAARAGWEQWHLPAFLSIARRPGAVAAVRTRTRPSPNWHGPVLAMSW